MRAFHEPRRSPGETIPDTMLYIGFTLQNRSRLLNRSQDYSDSAAQNRGQLVLAVSYISLAVQSPAIAGQFAAAPPCWFGFAARDGDTTSADFSRIHLSPTTHIRVCPRLADLNIGGR